MEALWHLTQSLLSKRKSQLFNISDYLHPFWIYLSLNRKCNLCWNQKVVWIWSYSLHVFLQSVGPQTCHPGQIQDCNPASSSGCQWRGVYGCREESLQLQCRHCKFASFGMIVCFFITIVLHKWGGFDVNNFGDSFLKPLYKMLKKRKRCYSRRVQVPWQIVFFAQDTNPIFLFNKEMILCDRAPTITKTTFSIENEMELKVEESLMMPAVFHTVASRTQLAVVNVLLLSGLVTTFSK